MPIPTIDLDTRRYADLVDEGRSLIPRYAPAWTNENASDPGIMLLELFAYLTEQLIYRANRVPERHRRKFLSLLGCDPAPPRPATTILAIRPTPAGDGATLPSGLALRSAGVAFRTSKPLTLTATTLVTVQAFDATRFTDVTPVVRAGSAFLPFGEDPARAQTTEPDAQPSLYLGFDGAIPAGRELALHVVAEGPPAVAEPAAHHTLRTIWEVRDGVGWRLLDPDLGEVEDDTSSLTVEGGVILRLPIDIGSATIGSAPQPLRYVRCRLVAGDPDTTSLIRGIAVNAVAARQTRPHRQTFEIAAGTTAPAVAPAPGTEVALNLSLDDSGAIVSFTAPGDAGPPVLALSYAPATATAPGSLTLACGQVGRGTAQPAGRLELPGAPVADGALALWSLEPDGALRWRHEVDLDGAGRSEAVFTLEPGSGAVTFGDGLHGRTTSSGVPLLAAYETTSAAAGNVPPAGEWTLAGADDALNAALLGGDPAVALGFIAGITCPSPAVGGADAETVASAAGRAAARLWAHERLVELAAAGDRETLDEIDRDAVLALSPPARATTLLDFERLALSVPGTRVARARAFGGIDAAHPGLDAPGTVTVVIVGGSPRGRPAPGPGLLEAVRSFLIRRKTLGTRLVVAGPRYVEIDVTVTLSVRTGASTARVQADAQRLLARHLDPLIGGSGGRGRVFGRDVYRSEIHELLDGVDGVDHVAALELRGPDGESCGNVCVPPTGLAVAGTIAIGVAT